MDAIKLLKQDHKRIKELLSEGADPAEHAKVGRAEVFDTLQHELKVHERREEEVLYPALKAHPKAKEIVLEGYEEHHYADMIVNDLASLDTTDDRWAAKFKVLKENLEHHIEEEEHDMFKKARRILAEDELEALGERMAEIRTPAAPPKVSHEAGALGRNGAYEI